MQDSIKIISEQNITHNQKFFASLQSVKKKCVSASKLKQLLKLRAKLKE